MAYRPSFRSKNEDLEMELDIRPVMNLMVVLIPLLLASAQWVKLGIIEINVPPAKAPGAGPGQGEETAKEKQLKLGLKIAITRDGITIGNAQTLLTGEQGEGPTVGLTEEGKYDFEKLHEKLVEIKKKILGKGFSDENRAVIVADGDIEYQTIIDVMDHIQTYEDDEGVIQPLFPEVNFSRVK
ncbi:MAG TPA: biopolymer transporter ExbD [Caldithrix abyssi]|uniref:Biopolymer transporter ExbD n=1 Tax=Caldithrix abyssi TaxID=187145 RepID=A0A7V5PP69_CALAY|nr:biopolymer transporter ExbD [Caldithrix abyssi]